MVVARCRFAALAASPRALLMNGDGWMMQPLSPLRAVRDQRRPASAERMVVARSAL